MIREHLPLALFTLLGQTAVGLTWILSLIETVQPSDRHALVPFLVMCSALFLSALHLHYPRNSLKALSNWAQSPLSQEALAAALFAFSTGIDALPSLGIIPSPLLPDLLMIPLRFLLGTLLIFTMARVYMLRTIPVWNRAATPLAFLSSTLLLGVLLHLVVDIRSSNGLIWGLLLFSFLLRLFASIFTGSARMSGGSIQLSRRIYPPHWRSLSGPGPTAAILAVLAALELGFSPWTAFRIPAFIMILASELIARIDFYTRHGHDRSLYPPVTPAVSSWKDRLVDEHHLP